MDRNELYNPGEEIIETDRLIMRRLRPDDYLAMAAWDMDERVYKYLMSSVCKTPEEPLVWLPKKDPTSKINILMLVIDKEDGHAVGTYALNHVVERDVWTLSYVNRFDDWGKGYATEAARLMINHAFSELGLQRLYFGTAENNMGMQRVGEKLGFKKAGTMRRAIYKNGKFLDIYSYDLLVEEWKSV